MLDAVRLSAEVARLPLPLAQTLRRALNAKSPQEAHTAAYYFFECGLKLSASAQIGVYVSLGCPDPKLNELIENITRASTGHWLAILREVSGFLARRPDKSLLPLSDVNERLARKEPRPAARAFLDFVARITEKPDGRKSLTCLDLFDAIVSYRNQELGHGAMRTREFYAEAAPLIAEAALEAFNALKPTGELQLSVARDTVDHRSGRAQRMYQRLAGDGIQAPVTGVQPIEDDKTILAGRVVLAGGVTRVMLHPLVVYEVDELERDRVGFVNLVSAKRVAAGTQMLQRQKDGTIRRNTTQISVKKVEYLDYDSGARIEGQDATEELADLLTRLRGTRVTADSVDRLAGEEPEEGAAARPALPRGDGTGEFIGDFEILEELGRGGMGIVYKARQASLGRIVALKVLPPALAGDPVAVTRFKREIAALGRCDHANVVKVLHAGQDGDRHFYAMEYVEGCDLFGVFGVMSQWMPQSHGRFRAGHLLAALSSTMQLRKTPRTTPQTQQELDPDYEPLPEAPKAAPVMPEFSDGEYYYTLIARIMSDAARGVGHLHEHGIIHRDIKPANIMLTGDGKRAIIMDLGLAAVAGQKGLSVANSAARIVGTLRYMPPEQLQRHLLDITNKADIYSLGATLYELATLAPIFDGDSEARLIQQVLQEQPVLPRKANPSVPEDLATIITVATAKNPNERYPSAEALARDLEAFARGDPISVRPPGALHYLSLFYRRNRALVHTAAVAVVLLIALTAWFMVNLNERRAEAEDARDQAELARADAVKQKGLAVEAARVAEEERRKAEAEEKKARAAEETAKKERDNAEREKEHAQNMERKATSEAERAEREAANARTQETEAKRQARIAEEEAEKARKAGREARVRYAESLVLQGDALVKGGRPEAALWTYKQALSEAKDLGIDTFPAESGLALLRQDMPSEIMSIESQPFQGLDFADLSERGERSLLWHSGGLELFDNQSFTRVWITRLGALRRGPVKISPDGRFAACATGAEVLVFDAGNGKELSRFAASEAAVTALCFSADGATLAVGDLQGGLFEFDWAAKARKAAYEGATRSISQVRFVAGDTQLAACGSACKIWFYDRAAKTLARELAAHETRIISLAFSHDGSRMLTGGYEGTALLWDLARPEQPVKLELLGSSIMDACFSARGERVALADFAGWLGVFDTADGKQLKRAPAHHAAAIGVAFIGDSLEIASVGTKDCPRTFSTDLAPLKFVPGHHNVVNGMQLSHDGRLAVAASYGECIVVWDTVTGTEVRRFANGISGIVRIDVSNDFRYVLGWGNSPLVTIWDVSSGGLALSLPQRSKNVAWAAISGDANFAALALADGSIEIWNLYTARLLRTIAARPQTVEVLDISADGKRLAVAYRGLAAIVYDISAEPKQLSYVWGAYMSVAFVGERGERILTADMQRSAQVWDVQTGDRVLRLDGHEGMIWNMQVSHDGSLAVTYSQDNTMRVWNLESGACRLVCPGPDSGVRACTISGDGRYAGLAGMDASLRFWSTELAVERRAFVGHIGDVTALVPIQKGRFAATGDEQGNLYLWETDSGQCLTEIRAHEGRISFLLMLNEEGRHCLSAGYDAKVRLWDLATGRCLKTFSGHTQAIYTLWLMPDGKTVLSAGADKRVLMWDLETLAIKKELPTEDRVLCVAYVPGLKSIYASMVNRRTWYFDPETGEGTLDEIIFNTAITRIAFSPDGTRMAVSGWASECYILETTHWRRQFELAGHTDSVTHVAFSEDGRYIVTSGDDGTLRFFSAQDGKSLRVIPHREFRQGQSYLTPDSRRLLFAGGEGTWHMWDLSRSALHDSLPQLVREARVTLQFDPDNGKALATLCRWYDFRGDRQRALEFFRRAEQAGESFEPSFVLSLAWRGRDLERALASLKPRLEDGSLDELSREFCRRGMAKAFHDRGREHQWSGRNDEALADLNQSLALDPESLSALVSRGRALNAKDQLEAALADFAAALKLEPDYRPALEARADVLALRGNFKAALADYVRLRELDPEMAWRWQRTGEIRCELQAYADAEKDFSKAIALSKDYASSWYWRAFARYKQGKLQDALKDANQYLALEPEVAAGFGQRGDIFRAAGRFKEAVDDYTAAIERDDTNAVYYECRAEARVRLQEYVACVADFRKALDLGAEKGSCYFNLACAYSLWAGSLAAGSERWAVDKALESLEEAVANGFADWELLKKDDDLKLLRNEPRFLKLIEGK